MVESHGVREESVAFDLLTHAASLSFYTHFQAISKGVIDLRDLLYFGTVIGVWLAANAIVLDMKKAD